MFGMHTRLRFTSLALLSALSLGGCTASDADKIADAQDCLDRSTTETALTCMEKVDGLNSAGAQLVRCSAYFIDQGFGDPSRLSRVAEELGRDGGGGGSSTIAVLSFMAFSAQKYDKSTNQALSDKAFTACQASNSKGMIYLSSLTQIATVALGLVGAYDPGSGVPPTEAQIREGLCTNATPTSRSVIGNATRTAYEQNCVGKTEPDPVCEQYAAAVNAGTTDEQIGQQLETNLCTP